MLSAFFGQRGVIIAGSPCIPQTNFREIKALFEMLQNLDGTVGWKYRCGKFPYRYSSIQTSGRPIRKRPVDPTAKRAAPKQRGSSRRWPGRGPPRSPRPPGPSTRAGPPGRGRRAPGLFRWTNYDSTGRGVIFSACLPVYPCFLSTIAKLHHFFLKNI